MFATDSLQCVNYKFFRSESSHSTTLLFLLAVKSLNVSTERKAIHLRRIDVISLDLIAFRTHRWIRFRQSIYAMIWIAFICSQNIHCFRGKPLPLKLFQFWPKLEFKSIYASKWLLKNSHSMTLHSIIDQLVR